MKSGCSKTLRVALMTLMLGVAPAGAGAASAQFEQHEVVAVFLFNFSHFITWPDSRFEAPSSPFRYCVVESQTVADALAEVIEGESSGGHPLQLVPVSGPEDLNSCHVVFWSEADQERFLGADNTTNGLTALTVTDSEDLQCEGAMIALGSTGPRVRPIINVAAVIAAGLQINSKLMSIAQPCDG